MSASTPRDPSPPRTVVLWATPRTISTAFERMMIERGDHVVLDEPWSRAYYLGPERRSDRFPLCFPESTYAAVEAGVRAVAEASDRPLFVKDMAYHANPGATPGITDDALASMSHTFLIRDPRAALTSLHRRWPDFDEDEAGYRSQRLLFDRVAGLTGDTPIVIDSDRLRADPQRVVAEWCRRVGIEHRPAALTWTAGMRPEWTLWRDWYANAAASTGFEPAGPTDDGDEVPDRVLDSAARATELVAPLRDVAI